MKKIHKIVIAVVAIFTINVINVRAQMPVQDKGLNGQMKRMVHQRWDDWQPTPNTNWLGIPKNLEGWTYWRVIQHAYWKGGDRRPWRANLDGPWVQNEGDIQIQSGLEDDMVDSVKHMAVIAAANEVNMMGGILDVPYQLYFGSKFDDMFGEVDKYLNVLQKASPKDFNEMANSSYGKEYMKRLDMMRDRIETVHSSFVDKGARMNSYFKIINELKPLVAETKAYIATYLQMLLLPKPSKVKGEVGTYKAKDDDPAIVKELLIRWQP